MAAEEQGRWTDRLQFDAIDDDAAADAARGEALYQQEYASWHEASFGDAGMRIAATETHIDDVGTDRTYIDRFSERSAR